MGIFLQYAPYTLRDASWDELREPYGDRVLEVIGDYAPNMRHMVRERQVLSPLDLERRFGISGGNIFHGEMSLDQMFVLRPVAGWARYKTPIEGLWLCGSGAPSGVVELWARRGTTPQERFFVDSAQPRFGELTVQGFRRLRDVRLALKPLSVMIGANSTGKTSVLDVLSLLASSAQGKLSSSISELSGLANVLTYDRADEVRLGISLQRPGAEPFEYVLTLEPQGIRYSIAEETLLVLRDVYISAFAGDIRYWDTEKEEGLSPTSWDHNPLETSLAQVPRMFRVQEGFRPPISIFNFLPRIECRSSLAGPFATDPYSQGSCLGETVKIWYRVSFISAKPIGIGSMRLKTRFGRLFHDLSDWISRLSPQARSRSRGESADSQSPFICINCRRGTLRYLWLTTLLQSPGPNRSDSSR